MDFRASEENQAFMLCTPCSLNHTILFFFPPLMKISLLLGQFDFLRCTTQQRKHIPHLHIAPPVQFLNAAIFPPRIHIKKEISILLPIKHMDINLEGGFPPFLFISL